MYREFRERARLTFDGGRLVQALAEAEDEVRMLAEKLYLSSHDAGAVQARDVAVRLLHAAASEADGALTTEVACTVGVRTCLVRALAEADVRLAETDARLAAALAALPPPAPPPPVFAGPATLVLRNLSVTGVPQTDANSLPDPLLEFTLLGCKLSASSGASGLPPPPVRTRDMRNNVAPTWPGPYMVHLPEGSPAATTREARVRLVLADYDPEDDDDPLGRIELTLSHPSGRIEQMPLVTACVRLSLRAATPSPLHRSVRSSLTLATRVCLTARAVCR